MSAVEELAAALLARGWFLATAESCTGGMIAAACTDLAGSSGWFERGFVTYSNEAKTELLGVPEPLIAQHGAVSEPVAQAMVFGVFVFLWVCVVVVVTGVAGPTGGRAAKPVGTGWSGSAVDGRVTCERQRPPGARAAVRAATVRHALDGLLARLQAAA